MSQSSGDISIRWYDVEFAGHIERVQARNHSQARYRAAKLAYGDNAMYRVWHGKSIKSCHLTSR